jgi:hypothetical protein
VARAHVFPPQEISRETLCEKLRGRTAARRYVELGRLDLLLLRINPINASVLSFASLVERLGVPVLCAPSALVRTSNKAYLATLTDVPTPRTLVSRSFSTLAAFAADQPTGTIIKPARASGGRGIQLVPPQSPIALRGRPSTAPETPETATSSPRSTSSPPRRARSASCGWTGACSAVTSGGELQVSSGTTSNKAVNRNLARSPLKITRWLTLSHPTSALTASGSLASMLSEGRW